MAQNKDTVLDNLYFEKEIPFYNEEYSKYIIAYSSNGAGEPMENNPYITPYLVEGSDKCVIIYPGGGYYGRSDIQEGAAIAKAYNQSGFSCFVVRYRTGSRNVEEAYGFRAILQDGRRAVQYVRYNAERFGIDPNKIAICGFSAGGHLAMSVSLYEQKENVVGDEIGEVSSLPNAVILGYPVTTLLEGSFSTMPPIVLKDFKDRSILEKFSGEKSATKKTPPTFIWYGEEDRGVLPEYNSCGYYKKLSSEGVLCELHSYSGIGHGAGLNLGDHPKEHWHSLSVRFLEKAL